MYLSKDRGWESTECPKKGFFFGGRAQIEGEKVSVALRRGGGGGAKGLSGRATKKRTFFCGFPNAVVLLMQ